MTAHAKLSPSGADKWMTCPGSIAAEEGLPDETSEAAAEGTFAHQISDECLMLGLDPYDFVGHKFTVEGFKFEFDEDMAEALELGIQQVRDFIAEGGTFYGEQQVDLTHWLGPDQFGTLDRAVVLPKLIVIDDLKFGRGVPVDPIQNKQLMLYALGFWWQFLRESHPDPDTEFLIIVDQPRCIGGGGEWRTTLKELLEFGEEARSAAEATNDPNAPRVASDKGCKWCKRREAPGGCSTFDEWILDMIGQTFEDIDEDAAMGVEPFLPIGMTPERRAHVVRHKALIEKWLDKLKEIHLEDALRGLPSGGLKAVEGRKSPDKWFNNVAAEEALEPIMGDERFTQKVKTPTQVLKAISLADHPEIELLINRGTKKPTLVSEADARPAIIPIEQSMDEVETEEE